MKVIIHDENGNIIFEHLQEPNYFYQKTGVALHVAILLEAAWRAQNPLYKSVSQEVDTFTSRQY